MDVDMQYIAVRHTYSYHTHVAKAEDLGAIWIKWRHLIRIRLLWNCRSLPSTCVQNSHENVCMWNRRNNSAIVIQIVVRHKYCHIIISLETCITYVRHIIWHAFWVPRFFFYDVSGAVLLAAIKSKTFIASSVWHFYLVDSYVQENSIKKEKKKALNARRHSTDFTGLQIEIVWKQFKLERHYLIDIRIITKNKSRNLHWKFISSFDRMRSRWIHKI